MGKGYKEGPHTHSTGGGSYTPGHTVTSDLKNVTKVTIDGKVVDSRYYTVNGGTVYLSGEFMKTLANGKHTVKLYDGAKVATGIITVTGNTNVASAATGDMGVALYAGLAISSLLGMGWVGKKKHDEELMLSDGEGIYPRRQFFLIVSQKKDRKQISRKTLGRSSSQVCAKFRNKHVRFCIACYG